MDALWGLSRSTTEDLVRRVLVERAFGRAAVVSSFGADSAVLLHLVAEVDPRATVLFVDTGRHFAETLAHRDRLAARLGLRDVRTVGPSADAVAGRDGDGALHATDPDACCAFRKVRPLEAALDGFDAWLTGRRRHQATSRGAMGQVETDAAGRVKVNPLADWSEDAIDAYLASHGLPAHPLTADGYPSIGCAPCTSRVAPGEDPRAGRWRGHTKTECGLHLVDGRLERATPT